MRFAVLLAAFALGGCMSTRFDPHAPKTVWADERGGAVTVKHGDRLRIPLANDPEGAYEWRRVEPKIVMVMPEGPPDTRGFRFTPVRSGEEKLRMEYRPVEGEGAAQRAVSYDVTVPERGFFGRMWEAIKRPFTRSKK
jgi:hypothetical protein